MSGLRAALRRVKESGVWNPSASAYIVRANLVSGDAAVASDAEALHAAAAWLCRAQDASTDGGVSGRYLLSRGWTSSIRIVELWTRYRASPGQLRRDRARPVATTTASLHLSATIYPYHECQQCAHGSCRCRRRS
jgi:hypothetical protein